MGRIVSDIPLFIGEWFGIWSAWNTKWIRNSLGNLLKGQICLIDPILSFSTHLLISTSEKFYLLLAILTLGTTGISCISAWSGANLPPIFRVVIRKPRFKYYMYTSLKALNIVMGSISCIWLSALKLIVQIDKIKKLYFIYKEYVCCHKYLLMKLDEFLGYFTTIPCHMDWFLFSSLPF